MMHPTTEHFLVFLRILASPFGYSVRPPNGLDVFRCV